MATINLTSTTGLLETDFDQIKLLIDGEDTGDLAANTVHRGSSGTDHTFIDQDVTSTGTPTFASVTLGGQTMSDILISSDGASTSDTALVTAGYVDAHGGGGGVSDLQGAFDGGQTITIADTDNQTLAITNNDNTNDPRTVSITNNTTAGNGLYVTTGTQPYVESTGLAYLRSVNASDTARVLNIVNSGTGYGVDVAQYGAAEGLRINKYAGSGQTGGVLRLVQDDAAADREVIYSRNDGTSYNTWIDNNGTGTALYVDQNGNGVGVHIDHEGTTTNALQVNAAVYGEYLGVEGGAGYGLYVDNYGTGNGITVDQHGNGIGLNIDNAGTKAGLKVFQTGSPDGDSEFAAAYIVSTAGNSNYNLVSTSASDNINTVINKNGVGGGNALQITNAGTGDGLFIDQNGDGVSLEIDSEATTQQAIEVRGVTTNADTVLLYNNGVHTSGNVLQVVQENASSTTNATKIKNDGTGNGLYIDQNGNGVGLQMDTEATTAIGMRLDADVMTTGSAIYVGNEGAGFTNTDGLLRARAGNAANTGTVALIEQRSTVGGSGLRILNDGTGEGLFIDQNGNGDALNISNSGTADGIEIQQLGLGRALYIAQNTNTTGQFIWKTSTGGGNALAIQNAGTGNALSLNQDGDSIALNIDSEATTAGNYGISVLTGQGAYVANFEDSSANYARLVRGNADGTGTNVFYRNITSATSNSPVVKITQDNAGDDQNALQVQQDGTGNGLFIDQNGNGVALNIDNAGTSSSLVVDSTEVIDSAGKVQLAAMDATGTPSGTTYLRGDGTWSTPAGGGGSGVIKFKEKLEGNVYTTTFLPIMVTDAEAGTTIDEVRISLSGLPTGSAFKVDVRKNGTATTNSIFTSDAEIEIGTAQAATNGIYMTGCSTAGATVGTPGTTIDAAQDDIAADDVLWVVITQVGSTIAGADFTCVITAA